MEPTPTALKIGVVFVGAGAGGVLRYWLGGLVQTWFGAHAPGWAAFPAGTVAVNVTGCFLIGVLAVALSGSLAAREEVRLALLMGLLGGYTTFSSFGLETIRLAQDDRWALAGANVVLSNVAALLAVFAGDRLAVRVFGGGS